MNAKFSDIKIGDEASFEVKINEQLIARFVALSGDDNPLHTDSSFAKSKGFERCVAHGMLLASFFSRLVGQYFLGDDNLYLSQEVKFKKPVLVGDTVTVKGSVKDKIESAQVFIIETNVINNKGEVVLSGWAKVKSK